MALLPHDDEVEGTPSRPLFLLILIGISCYIFDLISLPKLLPASVLQKTAARGRTTGFDGGFAQPSPALSDIWWVQTLTMSKPPKGHGGSSRPTRRKTHQVSENFSFSGRPNPMMGRVPQSDPVVGISTDGASSLC